VPILRDLTGVHVTQSAITQDAICADPRCSRGIVPDLTRGLRPGGMRPPAA